jgi:hypothetical protein
MKKHSTHGPIIIVCHYLGHNYLAVLLVRYHKHKKVDIHSLTTLRYFTEARNANVLPLTRQLGFLMFTKYLTKDYIKETGIKMQFPRVTIKTAREIVQISDSNSLFYPDTRNNFFWCDFEAVKATSMKMAVFWDVPDDIHQTTRCYTPEDSHFPVLFRLHVLRHSNAHHY